MRLFVCRIIIFFGLISPFSSVLADLNETSFLQGLVNQSEGFSYQGSAVHIRPSGMKTQSFQQLYQPSGLFKRIELTTPPSIEIITPEEKLVFNSAQKTVNLHLNQSHQALPVLLFENHEQIKASYDVMLHENVDFIAGRQARRLSYLSKEKDRFNHVYWFDAEQPVLLRTDTINEQGALIERMVLTGLSIGSINKSDIVKAIAIRDVKKYKWRYQKLNEGHIQFKNTSTGFMLHQSDWVESGDLKYERYILSDGLVDVEVTWGNLVVEPVYTHGAQMDALRVVSEKVGEQTLNIRGRAPLNLLETIRKSIETDD